jgi:hypothetical protein
MNPIRCRYQLATADADGLAQSQTLGAAGPLTLNGALVSGGVGTLDSGGAARRVLIISAADDSALTWTIVGTDRYGNAQTATLAGSNTGVYTKEDFLTVTQISANGATAGAVTAGTNGVGSTSWFAREFGSLGSLGALIYITGTVTADFEITWDDPNVGMDRPPYGVSVEPASDSPPKAIAVTSMHANNATVYGEISVPHFAFRMTITAGTDPAILQVIETTEINGGGY